MQRRHRAGHKGFALAALSFASVFSLIVGLALCMVKSPDVKADVYLDMAAQYQAQIEGEGLLPDAEQYLISQSLEMIHLALRQSPYNAKAWRNLSVVLARSDNLDHAIKARDIAQDLGLTELPTIHALRTLKPAHDIALSDIVSMAGVEPNITQ